MENYERPLDQLTVKELTTKESRNIIRNESLLMAGVGLILIVLIFIALLGIGSGIRAIINLLGESIPGLIGMTLTILLLSHLFGKRLANNHLNYFILAFLMTVLSLWFGTFCLMLYSFIENDYFQMSDFFHSVVFPSFLVFIPGAIPCVLLFVLLGVRIRNKVEKSKRLIVQE